MKKKIQQGIVIFFLLVVGVYFLYSQGYLFEIFIEPKVLVEDTVFTYPASRASIIMGDYTCPTEYGGEAVDECLLETRCMLPFISWDEFILSEYGRLEGTTATKISPSQLVKVKYETCNYDAYLKSKLVTYHYCGNGICETQEPYLESCESCSDDCGVCPEEPICTEGEFKTEACPDGSTINTAQCVSGEWVYIDEVCEELEEEFPITLVLLLGGLSALLVGLLIYKRRKK